MTTIHKDHTLEFPMPVLPKKPNFISRLVRAIKSGYIYRNDR